MNMKKGLAVAVILLFIGVAFAPCINANVSKEMVEFTTEVCGLNGGKQTVKLTQEEAEDVEALFDSIRERLNATESREEAEEIFKEAVVELDKYGLLGGLSVKQAQKLVTGGYQKVIIKRILNRAYDINPISLDENENIFCLIFGKSSIMTGFERPISGLLIKLALLFYWLDLEKLGSWFILFWLISSIFVFGNPIAILYKIGLGLYSYEGPYRSPAKGWICSLGMNGKKIWNKSFYGQLPLMPISILVGHYYPGIIGYTGIKLQSRDKMDYYYLGSAIWAKIGSEPPEF